MQTIRIIARIFLIVSLLVVGVRWSVKTVSALCIVERGQKVCYTPPGEEEVCEQTWQTGACGKADAHSQGYCGPGEYQVYNGGCRAYGPMKNSNPGGDDNPPPCPCGNRTCEDGECWCSPTCNPPRCGAVIPQNSITDQTSGAFLLYATGVLGPDNTVGQKYAWTQVDFWAEGPTGARVSYSGINDAYDTGTQGNYHATINLGNHLGNGITTVGVTIISNAADANGNWQSATCTSSFNRPRYITGNVYFDPTGTCSTAQPWTQSDDLIVSYNDFGTGYGADVITSVVEPSDVIGKYVLGDVPADNVSLQLLNLPDVYMCSPCSPGCLNKTNIAPGSSDNNFFLKESTMKGHVYYDPNGTCSTGQPWNKTSDLSIGYNSGGVPYQATVQGDGTYELDNGTGGAVNLSIMNLPAAYMCSSCNPLGCPTIYSVGPSSVNNNFFLSDLHDPWWQVQGAGIYAGGSGVAVRSILPDSSTRLILAGTGGTGGALFTASGQSDLGNGTVSDPGWNAKTTYRGKIMDYNYFAAHMGVIPSQANDWISNNLDSKPSADGHDFYYQAGNSTISVPWVIGAGESYAIFINGDLRINANITVTNGGFLAFIVKGNINVDDTVTQVQGLYVTSGNYTSESRYVLGSVDDVQLEVQGSLVSWGNVNLHRNLGGDNTTTPGDKFVYRVDLLSNMPDNMKTFAMNWQEVVPGTFGD